MHMLMAKSINWQCFTAGFLTALTPLTILYTGFGITLKAIVGMLLTAIPIGEAVFDFAGSRTGCMR